MDNFVYPNGTLKNKLGIQDKRSLEILEYQQTSLKVQRLLEHHPKITSIEDLNKIHFMLFSSLYDWAGVVRNYDISKEGFHFLETHALRLGANNIQNQLNDVSKKKQLDKRDYAQLLDSLNYYHPFREGNGRSTRLFLQILATNHNQLLDYPRSNKELIKAEQNSDINSISSFLKLENKSNSKEVFDDLINLNYSSRSR